MILVCLLLLAQVSPELTQHVNAGLRAKQAGDLPTAIREFQKVVELAPALAAAHVNLGAVYYEARDYGHAIPALRKGLALNPELPGAQGMLGMALLTQGFAAEAIAHLEKGQSVDLLGVALLEVGRDREALDRLEASLQSRPNDPDLLYYLGRAHARLAQQVTDRLGTEFPTAARTVQLRGEARTAAGDQAGATQEYQAALKLRPDLHGVHLALGEIYLSAGDYPAAEKEFRAEAELVPGSAAAAYQLGAVLLNLGDPDRAVKELQRAETLKPGMPETLLALGRAQVATGATREAEKNFLRVIEQEKKSLLTEAAHFQLTQLYRQLGRTAEADRHQATFQALRAARKQ